MFYGLEKKKRAEGILFLIRIVIKKKNLSSLMERSCQL